MIITRDVCCMDTVPIFDCFLDAYVWVKDLFPSFKWNEADKVASTLWSQQLAEEQKLVEEPVL